MSYLIFILLEISKKQTHPLKLFLKIFAKIIAALLGLRSDCVLDA